MPVIFALNCGTQDKPKKAIEGNGFDPLTRLMDKWEYVLEAREPPPTVAWWKDWQTFGGIKLALHREFEGRPVRIYFKDVKVSAIVDENIFGTTFAF